MRSAIKDGLFWKCVQIVFKIKEKLAEIRFFLLLLVAIMTPTIYYTFCYDISSQLLTGSIRKMFKVLRVIELTLNDNVKVKQKQIMLCFTVQYLVWTCGLWTAQTPDSVESWDLKLLTLKWARLAPKTLVYVTISSTQQNHVSSVLNHYPQIQMIHEKVC